MADELFVEEGEDGNLSIVSSLFGTAIAICREIDGRWFATEDDSFSEQVGAFADLDDLVDHFEKERLFGPWGSPGSGCGCIDIVVRESRWAKL